MCNLKAIACKVFLITFIVKSVHLISSGTTPVNATSAEILWNLTNYAIQGRQNGYGFQPGNQINQQYAQYPNQQFPNPNNQYPPQQPNYYGGQQIGAANFGAHPPPQSFMDALASVAENDELHCVPRLLCELTSGSRTGNNIAKQSILPFNLNMDSLLGILSTFSGPSQNPLLLFGRAALLGYSSRGNSHSCINSFPRCPSDADQLVNYLNNYNGGFFRYFNGAPLPPQNQFGYPPPVNQRPVYNNFLQGQHPQIYRQYAEQRIQTKPNQYQATSLHDDKRLKLAIKFPADNSYASPNEITDSFYPGMYRKSPKTLTFPGQETFAASQFNFRTRQPKTLLAFPNKYNGYDNGYGSGNGKQLDFQRPLPNHVASPMIFPTRTGTGELILDSDTLEKDLYFPYNYNKYNAI